MTLLSSTRGPALASASRKGIPLVARPLQRVGLAAVSRALSHVRHGGITLLDGETVIRSPGAREADPVVRINNPSFYAAAAFGGSIGIAESFIDGHWSCSDLPGLIETITVNSAAMEAIESPLSRLLEPLGGLAYWLERNTRSGSRENIAAHYDLGNEFFALFLDESMTYSAGVFEHAGETLAQAQFNKIDRACRALGLTPDDHLLEIGTGWGSLAVHAVRHYGCRVTTTTISQKQFDGAAARIKAAGLEISGRINLVKTDYRDLKGTFDKVVSIEMVEAVGRANIPVFFRAVSERLKPEGAAFVQAIVIRDQFFDRAARTRDFLKKYIFPGSCLLSVNAIVDATSRGTDLRLWGLTDIGDDYDRTLAMWADNLSARHDRVRQMGFDERFIRMWDFYFAYCRGAFRARHCGDVQVLLTKPLCRLPRFDAAVTSQAGRPHPASCSVSTRSQHTPVMQGSPA